MTPAERSKLRRSREARGVRVYAIELGREDFNALIWAGLLDDARAGDKREVEKALADQFAAFAKHVQSSRVTNLATGRGYDNRERTNRNEPSRT